VNGCSKSVVLGDSPDSRTPADLLSFLFVSSSYSFFFLIDFGSLICGFNLLFWVGLKMIDECLMVVVMMF
jgi:hypothetical protein